jgi:hypothetical protein
VKILSFVEK